MLMPIAKPGNQAQEKPDVWRDGNNAVRLLGANATVTMHATGTMSSAMALSDPRNHTNRHEILLSFRVSSWIVLTLPLVGVRAGPLKLGQYNNNPTLV